MKYFGSFWLMVGSVAMMSCSTTQSSRFFSQSYDDDLYFISSGESALYVEESRKVVQESDGKEAAADPYDAYLSARNGNNSGVSPYDYNERSYDRNMRRHADPMWSDPSFGMGMGGFFGSRSYMLYNPYFPPFWSMQPGFSMGWNSMGGMHMGMNYGFGSPFMGGMGMGMGGMGMGMYNPYSPFYDPFMMGGGWGNPYAFGMQPWGMQPWGIHPWGMNPWGMQGGNGGWANGGFNDVNRLPVAPPRGGGIGGGRPGQSNLFNPNPGRNTGSTSEAARTANTRINPSTVRSGTAPGTGRQTTSPSTRPERETSRTTRPTSGRTPDRGTYNQRSTTPSRETVTPPSSRPSRPSGGSIAPARGGSSSSGSTASPSRGSSTPSGSSSRPSGGSRPTGGRPR